MTLPEGLDPHVDVAVERDKAPLTVHAVGGVVSGCGCPMWAMKQAPYPAAGHMDTVGATFCPECWPRESGWSRMLAAAELNSARRLFGHINSSARFAGYPSDERSRP